MNWICPHCKITLAVGEEHLASGWSFSQCYQCSGYALIRKTEISVIKVDKAPPSEKIIHAAKLVSETHHKIHSSDTFLPSSSPITPTYPITQTTSLSASSSNLEIHTPTPLPSTHGHSTQDLIPHLEQTLVGDQPLQELSKKQSNDTSPLLFDSAGVAEPPYTPPIALPENHIKDSTLGSKSSLLPPPPSPKLLLAAILLFISGLTLYTYGHRLISIQEPEINPLAQPLISKTIHSNSSRNEITGEKTQVATQDPSKEIVPTQGRLTDQIHHRSMAPEENIQSQEDTVTSEE